MIRGLDDLETKREKEAVLLGLEHERILLQDKQYLRWNQFKNMVVMREAIVNFLVYRNYSINRSKIGVFMSDDRIEFRSPGRLPNTVTIEKMKVGVSYARNPFLVKYMENMRYIDQLGRGILMIIKKMKDLGAKKPLLIEQGEEFILAIYKASFFKKH